MSEPQSKAVRPGYVVPLALALTLLLGGLAGAWLDRALAEPRGMEVTFNNTSDSMINSIKLDFGNADGQSSLLALRIPSGGERTLLLNHEPGMGFNVRVSYSGGHIQEFCALKGDDRRKIQLDLHP